MARHSVLLLDVSSELDAHCPDSEMTADMALEGARHLEEGIFERTNRLADIHTWNAKVRANTAALDLLIRGRVVRRVLRGRSFVGIIRQIRQDVRALR